jgi:hypothetical protein
MRRKNMAKYNVNYLVVNKATDQSVGVGYTFKRQAIAKAKRMNDWTDTKDYYVIGGTVGKGRPVVWKP